MTRNRKRIALTVTGAALLLGGGLALSGCGGSSGVQYEVTGDGPVTVNYSTIGESGAESHQETQPGPFTRELPKASGQFTGATMVVMQTGPNAGPVGCKLTVDGKVIDQKFSQPNHGPESYGNTAVCAQMPQMPGY